MVEVINRIGKDHFFRSIVHLSSLVFLFVLWFIIAHQQNWINRIVNNYFEVNIRSVLLFFSASDSFQTLKDYLTSMGTELALLFAVESLAVVTGVSIIGYFLWKLKRIDRLFISEKILLAGYLLLVVSSIVIVVRISLEVYQTYHIIDQRVSQLSVQEISDLQTQLTNAFFDTSFSVDRLLADIASLLEQIRSIIQKTSDIAAIPSMLSQSWSHILLLKNNLIGYATVAVLVIVIAHGLALIKGIKKSNYLQMKLKTPTKARQIDVNEQLVTVIKQQKELIEILSKKD